MYCGVEADRQGIALIAGFERVFGFAGFGGGGGKFDFALFQPQAHGARALVGELGHAGDGRAQLVAGQGDALVVVLGQHRFVVGELAR